MSAPLSEYAYPDAEGQTHHDYIRPLITGHLRRHGVRTLLDLGCGNGALTRAFRRDGFDVVGCDPSTTGIAQAREADPQGEYLVAGVDDAGAFAGRKFDAVVAVEVIEHLFLPRKVPAFARSVLVEGGRLVVTTPYHGYLKNLAIALLGKWDLHHTSWWDHGHVKFFSRKTLGWVLDSEGFAEEWFAGAGRLPYLWKSMIGSYRIQGPPKP